MAAHHRDSQAQGMHALLAEATHARALLEVLQEGVVLQDANSRIVAANAAAERILGLPVDQMQGLSSLDPEWRSIRRDGSDWPGHEHPVPVCLSTGEPQRNRIMGVRSAGRLRWININAEPLFTSDEPDARPSGAIATFSDITETVVGTDALCEATQRLSMLSRNGDLLLRVAPHGEVRYVSAACHPMLGRYPEELVGRNVAELVHPDDRLEPTDADLHSVGTYRLRHRDGSYRSVEAVCYLRRDAEGALEEIDVVARDVTDREVALEALRQAEERFRLAFDMAPIGNAIVLPDGRFMRVNAQFASMVGVPEPRLLGDQMSAYVRPEDRARLSTYFATVLAEEGPHKCEVRLDHESGRPVHAAVTASVVAEADGSPAYVIAQVEDITTRKLAQAALTHQATHDPLTALPNRTLLLDRLGQSLERARRNGTHVALLFCDVDRFKRINDSLGHEVGDLLLVEIARRLRSSIRGTDTAGRLSGDEFLAICEDLGGPEEALLLAERVRAITDDPIQVAGQLVSVSLSIGVAHAGADDEPAVLLRQADTAMYEAKERGRGRFEVYNEALRERARQRLQLENELRSAVAGDQLRLFHQPIVDLADGRILGREALIRWQHPTRGLLTPGAFLEVAEETDLIIDLGAWVLGEACRQGAQLSDIDGGGHVAINVSARQLGRPDFRWTVEQALDISGLQHEQLVLELTETSLLKAAAGTLADVEALTRRGVRLAVDDFGTGYSSLTYLQRLPVGVVKIDRSFVADITTDPKRRAIAQAVISLGQALELDIIAEGVETPEQAAILSDLGCLQAQGYLFGRPAPLDPHDRVSTHVA